MIQELAYIKYQYVVAAQEFGTDLAAQLPADGCEASPALRAQLMRKVSLYHLLVRYPSLRIATIEKEMDAAGRPTGHKVSVLYRLTADEDPLAERLETSLAALPRQLKAGARSVVPMPGQREAAQLSTPIVPAPRVPLCVGDGSSSADSNFVIRQRCGSSSVGASAADASHSNSDSGASVSEHQRDLLCAGSRYKKTSISRVVKQQSQADLGGTELMRQTIVAGTRTLLEYGLDEVLDSGIGHQGRDLNRQDANVKDAISSKATNSSELNGTQAGLGADRPTGYRSAGNFESRIARAIHWLHQKKERDKSLLASRSTRHVKHLNYGEVQDELVASDCVNSSENVASSQSRDNDSITNSNSERAGLKPNAAAASSCPSADIHFKGSRAPLCDNSSQDFRHSPTVTLPLTKTAFKSENKVEAVIEKVRTHGALLVNGCSGVNTQHVVRIKPDKNVSSPPKAPCTPQDVTSQPREASISERSIHRQPTPLESQLARELARYCSSHDGVGGCSVSDIKPTSATSTSRGDKFCPRSRGGSKMFCINQMPDDVRPGRITCESSARRHSIITLHPVVHLPCSPIDTSWEKINSVSVQPTVHQAGSPNNRIASPVDICIENPYSESQLLSEAHHLTEINPYLNVNIDGETANADSESGKNTPALAKDNAVPVEQQSAGQLENRAFRRSSSVVTAFDKGGLCLAERVAIFERHLARHQQQIELNASKLSQRQMPKRQRGVTWPSLRGPLRLEAIYRIRLPLITDESGTPWARNPVIGPGKPENQNHAIAFSRMDTMQVMDMNMESYLEEAIKLRNLLQEFVLNSRMRILGRSTPVPGNAYGTPAKSGFSS